MNILQRWITHRKLDKLYNRLLDELGPVAKKDRPKLILDKKLGPRSPARYCFTVDGSVNEIRLPSKYYREGSLAHEVGHATGFAGLRGNPYMRRMVNLGYLGARSPVFNTVTQLAGLGELSALAHLMRLGEEGQATVRGLQALKKIKGNLNSKDINRLAYGYSTYITDSVLRGLLIPKAVQEGANLITNHSDKVLLDSLVDTIT